MILLDGKKIANQIKDKLKLEVKELSFTPSLAIVQIGDDYASNKYISYKMAMANKVGIACHLIKLRPYISQHDLEVLMHKLAKDNSVNGIILQLPIPDFLDKQRIINIIPAKKDVDGLTEVNSLNLDNGQWLMTPATPKGILRLLNEYKITIKNKEVVIVGKSQLVGSPLAKMMEQIGANVTVLDKSSPSLSPTKKADILISAAGSPNLIGKKDVKKNVVIIDVGISKVKGKTVGDVNFKEVKDIASFITPIIGGVGPMTVISLFENMVKSIKA